MAVGTKLIGKVDIDTQPDLVSDLSTVKTLARRISDGVVVEINNGGGGGGSQDLQETLDNGAVAVNDGFAVGSSNGLQLGFNGNLINLVNVLGLGLTVDDGGIVRITPSPAAIADDNSVATTEWVRDLVNEINDFIPLSGTNVGSNVTGDIIVNDGVSIYCEDGILNIGQGSTGVITVGSGLLQFLLGDSQFNITTDGYNLANQSTGVQASFAIDNLTIQRNYKYPDNSGTFALLSDIPASQTIDSVPTDGSNNAVSSNGTFDAIEAAKAYADGLVTSVFRAAGNWDASVGTFPTTGTGSGGAIRRGDTYIVSVAGTMGGKVYDVGDSFYANVAAPAQTAANWSKFEANTEQATSALRGTVLIFDATGTSTTGTMTQNSITNALALKLNAATGGNTGQYYSNANTYRDFDTQVRVSTIGTNSTAGATTQVTSGVAFREALYYLQNQVNASALDNNLTKTANYTVLATDYGRNGMLTIFSDATAGAVTITLEAASTMAGKTVHVVKTDASANAVTVKGNGTTNINMANTMVLGSQYERSNIKSNGTQYYIF